MKPTHTEGECCIKYDAEYDAHYCVSCNVWTEGKCSDPQCEFCAKRPNIPPSEKTNEI